MKESQIIWMLVAEFFFVVLFFYVLYLIGGIYQRVKRILDKVESIQKKLEKTA